MFATFSLRLALAAVAVFACAACGGGGSGGGAAAVAISPTPSPPPLSGSTTMSPQAAATPTALPSVAGYSGSILVPSGSGGPITVRVDSTGLPALPAGSTALLLFTYTANADATLSSLPGLTFSVPASAPAGPYRVAAFAGGAWTTVEGPSTQSGQTFTIAASGSATTLLAGHFIQLTLYSGTALP